MLPLNCKFVRTSPTEITCVRCGHVSPWTGDLRAIKRPYCGVPSDRRAALLAARSLQQPRPATPSRGNARSDTLPCVHRGEEIRRVGCPSCPGRTVQLKVFACSEFGECCVGKTAEGVHSCRGCSKYEAPAAPYLSPYLPSDSSTADGDPWARGPSLASKPPLAVGLITPCFNVGGVERQWLSLCRHWSGSQGGVIPAGIALTGHQHLEAGMLEEARRYGPVYGLSRVESPERAVSLLRARSDVLIVWMDPIARHVAGFNGPIVLVSHGSATWTKNILTSATAAATHFAAVSAAARDVFPAAVRDRVRVISNGIDLDRCVPTRTIAKDPASIAVGYVGRYSAEKNPQAAATAVAELVRRGMPARAVYHCPEAHRKLVDQGLGNLPHVLRSGHVGDTLAEIDCIVMASYDEGCCLVVLEAMAAGVPVISTPTGEIVPAERRHGPLVERVPIGADPAAIADAVLAAVAPENAPRVARARAIVWNHYASARMAEDWRRFLLEISGRSP